MFLLFLGCICMCACSASHMCLSVSNRCADSFTSYFIMLHVFLRVHSERQQVQDKEEEQKLAGLALMLLISSLADL